MDRKIWMALAVIAVLAVGAYAVSKNTSPSYAPQTGAVAEVKTITVSGNEFSFSPNTIALKKGESVKVIFANTGKYPHNFVINELGVKSNTINAGETTATTFVADKTGSFAFYCSVGTHREKGMVGTLTVEE